LAVPTQSATALARARWNGADPILKERLFVKEYYFCLDNTLTHSYIRYLDKYPQRAYPYEDIVATNRRRTRNDFEYELLNTGVFDDDRYFDVFVEYAKAAAENLLIRVTVHNRGPEDVSLHVVPTLWFRNTWSWVPGGIKPVMADFSTFGCPTIHAAQVW
jgi:hypothetical protein